jgi:uncharacterized membrane protein YfcA
MRYPYEVTLLILCPLIFLASFIDSIAGGGGLISLPAYIFAGLPIHNAYGTNKFPASLGTMAAMGNYFKGGCIDFSVAIPGGIAAIIGSWIGTRLALSLSPRVLQICLIVILPLVGIFILTRRSSSRKKNVKEKSEMGFRLKLVLSSMIGLVFGCYDGFFGPGAGMFMTIALSSLLGMELIKAVGTTKVLNFSSNIASMFTWFVSGKILFPIALPCAICSIAGGFLGSRMAIKIGKNFIRYVLALVTLLLFIKILFDLYKAF